jgi:hypothetical protein
VSDQAPERQDTLSDLAQSKTATPSDHAESDQAISSEPAPNPTIFLKTTTENNLDHPTSINQPKINLYHAHKCSLEFKQYKQNITFPSNLETLLYNPIALNACNNKEDILTQSQMFKIGDASKFIACQEDEMSGLRKFDAIDICFISFLPPRAQLLSSIWSYCRERLPNGILLKHKSRIYVNGKEQACGRDYWECKHSLLYGLQFTF